MKTFLGLAVAVFLVIIFVSSAEAINIDVAEVQNGSAVVQGGKAAANATITWEGGNVATANKNGGFKFSGVVPADCVGTLSDGKSTIEVVVLDCTTVSAGGRVLATGQTTPFQVDKKNDGIPGAVAVNDDGTLQLGLPLQYQDNGNGTVTDLNTSLIREKKVAGSGCLHCVDNLYHWTAVPFDAIITIWDWLDDLNASNFAGHNDWRIPNVKELFSIIHYGYRPFIDPIFGPTQSDYASSTTLPIGNGDAYLFVLLDNPGGVGSEGKGGVTYVRAVRGP